VTSESRAPVSAEPRLDGKLAIVTGAARGIGRASALALTRAGADVALMDVLDVEEAAGAVRVAGGRPIARRVDVSDRMAVQEAVADLSAERGGIDVLVTAAGIYGTTSGLDDLNEEEVEQVLAVNLKGTLWMVQAAYPHMTERGGKIVCIGSVAGKVGGLLAGPHYVASKGGIHALVKWLAKAGAPHGVYANGIAPGAIETDMIEGKGYAADYCPLGRLGQPEDIAEAVVFLASPASNYITGIVLDVNGGYYMG
jgi:3-oxoacyl-[acyl-carrier protein] reductase